MSLIDLASKIKPFILDLYAIVIGNNQREERDIFVRSTAACSRSVRGRRGFDNMSSKRGERGEGGRYRDKYEIDDKLAGL